MTLQNRVRPDGCITNDSWRGMFMGNRGGKIHDTATQTLTRKNWASKRWIICVTQFKCRKRKVMGEGYTELFFLDEVSALACGHRPCFECRRSAAVSFAEHWQQSFGEIKGSKANTMDKVLHKERTGVRRMIRKDSFNKLPDGAFIAVENTFLVRKENQFLQWSGDGYSRLDLLANEAILLTPPSILKVLSAGYQPQWHTSIRGSNGA